MFTNAKYDLSYTVLADWAFYNDAINLNGSSFSHVGEVVAIYDCGGMSSQPEAQAIIEAEMALYFRQRHDFYFPLLLSLYNENMDILDKKINKVSQIQRFLKWVKKQLKDAVKKN